MAKNDPSFSFWAPVLFLSLIWGAAGAAAPAGTAVGGPAFTDPDDGPPMPAEWVARPVVHPPELGGADLAVTLDQQLYPVLLPWIRDFARAEGVEIAVREGTCGVSAANLVDKEADIGGFCCPPGREDRLPGLRFHTLGIAAVALLVHPDNPVDNVSLAEARGLFQGSVPVWSEVSGSGGFHERVRPVGRLHCKMRPGRWRRLLDHEDLFSPRMEEVGTIPDMIARVAAEPGAVGHETLKMARRYGPNGAVRVLAVDDVRPDDTAALVRGEYPIYRTFNLTTWEGAAENPLAEQLVDHLLDAFQRSVPPGGFVAASRLRAAGWRFHGNELVGEPGRTPEDGTEQ